MTLLMSGGLTIGVSAIVFLLITLILVGLLLFCQSKIGAFRECKLEG